MAETTTSSGRSLRMSSWFLRLRSPHSPNGIPLLDIGSTLNGHPLRTRTVSAYPFSSAARASGELRTAACESPTRTTPGPSSAP
ncbi:Uncharacterised protein [Mycobacteroides abscessus]|nr:Uncharacterised protein [Mycobacteroides abscessus]